MTVSLHLLRRCISNIRNIKKKVFFKYRVYCLPPYPFGDRLAEQQHPVGHVLFVVSAELQWGALCQDDLEGMWTVCAV